MGLILKMQAYSIFKKKKKINQSYINRQKKTNEIHMVTSTDTEKIFDKIQHHS